MRGVWEMTTRLTVPEKGRVVDTKADSQVENCRFQGQSVMKNGNRTAARARAIMARGRSALSQRTHVQFWGRGI